jgi:hypothetical protein
MVSFNVWFSSLEWELKKIDTIFVHNTTLSILVFWVLWAMYFLLFSSSILFLGFCLQISLDCLLPYPSLFTMIIQGDRKVTQPILDTFCLSKNKLHWNQKTKNNVILSVGSVHCIQWCMHSLFSSCLMQPGEEFLQWRLKCMYTIWIKL